MKLICLLATAVLPLTLLAQPRPTDESPETTQLEWWSQKLVVETPSISYDKIVHGKVTYTGIGVQLIQAEQPLQLLNPYAPPSYGDGEQNLSSDPMLKPSIGLKFLAINF